jgi:hypothetical protein
MFRNRLIAAAAIIAFWPSAAAYAGVALAVGTTDNPKDGIAFGYSYNYDKIDEAEKSALDSCKTYKPAPKAAARCKLFDSLPKGCFAVAFDPKDDSPGMGWAVHERREAAEREAIDKCRLAAPKNRRQYCKIDTLKCDGDTPPK